MIAFLVFSDWANPSQTIIHKKDGTRMQVAVLLETTEMLRVQFEEPVGDLKKGREDDVPKADIERTERPRRPTISGRSGCTIIAGTLPAPASWLRWRWSGRGLTGRTVRLDGADVGLCEVDRSVAVGGVLVTGFVGALIPEEAVADWVGGNSFQANMVASVIGAMWYFATLTEIPIWKRCSAWAWDGAGVDAAAGRPRPVAAQYRGYLQRGRVQENGGVRRLDGRDQRGGGNDLRLVLR